MPRRQQRALAPPVQHRVRPPVQHRVRRHQALLQSEQPADLVAIQRDEDCAPPSPRSEGFPCA